MGRAQVTFSSSMVSGGVLARKHPKDILHQTAPDLDCVIVPSSDPLRLSQVTDNGQPTVVLFHTSWCGACQPAGRLLDDLAADPRYRDCLDVVLVNIESSLTTAELFAKQNKIEHALVLCTTPESSKVCHAEYGIKYIPHQVVMDAKGKVVMNFD